MPNRTNLTTIGCLLRPSHRLRPTPPAKKDCHAQGKKPWTRSQGTCGKDVDEQDPHPGQLSEASEVKHRTSHRQLLFYMRSKFFSISRRVSRSMTGRPCGQTVE